MKGNIEKIKKLLKGVFIDIMSKREIEELIKEIKKESEEKNMLSIGQRIVIQMKKEGRAEGRAEEKMQIAKEMLKEKIALEKIAKVTKLKEEDLKQMQKQIAV